MGGNSASASWSFTPFKMSIGKIQKPAINPQELAQKVANEGLKASVDKAIESSEKEYRSSYKKLLESKGFGKKSIGRFQRTEVEVAEFLDHVYESLPDLFRKMIDDAVDEQSTMNKLTQKHKDELRRELANVIDQELRLKGKFA